MAFLDNAQKDLIDKAFKKKLRDMRTKTEAGVTHSGLYGASTVGKAGSTSGLKSRKQ